jgi:hypothetical protein
MDKKVTMPDSDSGSEASVPPPTPSTARTFQVLKKSFHRQYELLGDHAKFYADISVFTPKKPDLTLHAGTDTNGPIVAVSSFLKFSGQYKIGLGDPAGNDIRWEDMKRGSLRALAYRWEMELNGERRAFVWKHTRTVGVDNKAPSRMSGRNWKLVDASNNEVLAVFTRDRSLSKCGDLQITVDYGHDFDSLVLITYLSLYEKARRRNSSHGGGGA